MRGHFVTEAQHRLSAAAAGHGAGLTRARALSKAKLASLAMAIGDPVEAAVLGGRRRTGRTR